MDNGDIGSVIGWLAFWGFIVVKVSGHIFEDWSWLWVFIPIIPWIGVLVARFGL